MSGHTPWKYIEHKSDRPWTKLWKRVQRGMHRKAIENHKRALEGRTTSGHLSAGERARIFRNRDRMRSRVSRRK